MFTNEPAAIRAAILAGSIQQIQAEPQFQRPARSTVVRGALVGQGASGAAIHRRLY
jgi:hypothetical protein